MTNGWLRPVLTGLLIAIVVSVLNRWHWHPAAVFLFVTAAVIVVQYVLERVAKGITDEK